MASYGVRQTGKLTRKSNTTHNIRIFTSLGIQLTTVPRHHSYYQVVPNPLNVTSYFRPQLRPCRPPSSEVVAVDRTGLLGATYDPLHTRSDRHSKGLGLLDASKRYEPYNVTSASILGAGVGSGREGLLCLFEAYWVIQQIANRR